MEKLLTEKETETLPIGTELIEVNRHKKGGYIEEIKCTIGECVLGRTLKFGIWCNWNEDDWDVLGYKLVKMGSGK